MQQSTSQTTVLGLPINYGRSFNNVTNYPEKCIDIFPAVIPSRVVAQTLSDRRARPDIVEPASTGYPAGWSFRYWYTNVAQQLAKTDA